MGQEGAERKYTLAEKNIQHAKENLPKQIYTQEAKLTRQVHNLYIDCLFDKLWEPALPGLPYRPSGPRRREAAGPKCRWRSRRSRRRATVRGGRG